MTSSSTDLRGLLSYVPLFRGKAFVVDMQWNSLAENAQAEVVMDLKALQSIGVKLVIVSSEKELENFLDWAADHEFRSSLRAQGTSNNEIEGILKRGQAALLVRDSGLLSKTIIDVAVELGATKLIALFDIQPIVEKGQIVKFLRVEEIGELSTTLTIEQQCALDAAALACEAGVERVHLLNANTPGVLIDELFSSEGVGTMLYGGTYRTIRLLKEEDISELLGMIGRSVRRTHLVPRTYEQISDSLENYAVMEVDGHVVGCVALYAYGEISEIACLYVKQSHEGTGYGADLVHFMEARARERGAKRVFALTNRAASFFTNQMKYQPMLLEQLPSERLKNLKHSGRESQAFLKIL